MKKATPITAIMTEHPVCLQRGQSLEEAEPAFRNFGFRHLPVVENDKLVGILSRTDLNRVSFADAVGDDGAVDTAVYSLLSLDQIMVSKPTTLTVNATVRDAAEVLSKKEFHALPVMDGDRLAGIVTTTDLIAFLLQQLS